MLNKDEYNQQEYNDYYRQESEGAEVSDVENEEGGGMNKLIGLLVLIALVIGGYFGYKKMNSGKDASIDNALKVSTEATLPLSIQEETKEKVTHETTKKVEVKKAPESTTVQTAVAKEIEKSIPTGKMSPDEVAAIVAAVMQQMNQKESVETATNTPMGEKNDLALMNELSNTDVDSVSKNLVEELEKLSINEETHLDNSKKQIDVYNKVNVQNSSGLDALSQLSDQISSVINEGSSESSTTYTTNITKEVATRQNEMRVIVVRSGDTLGKISLRAYGNTSDFKKIYRANPEVTRPDRIYIGQKLRIPN